MLQVCCSSPELVLEIAPSRRRSDRGTPERIGIEMGEAGACRRLPVPRR